MKQIKFRAWDKYNNKIITPYKGDFISWCAPSNWNELYDVMQFTGLLDKNGKEIYEGDIVKSGNWTMTIPSVFELIKMNEVEELMNDVEVVGNIYENK